MEVIAETNVPFEPDFVRIRHPASNETFLRLPANNVTSANQPPTFGVHLFTVLTACQILTNKTGFLSLSRDRAEVVDSTVPDRILTRNEYYYHINDPETDPLYPICLDFSEWRFPHGQLPQAWHSEQIVSWHEDEVRHETWSVISALVKGRDKRCRLSGWRDGMTTARIIPSTEEVWMDLNNMHVYSARKDEPKNDSRNLFALRWDLYSLLFDQAKWVIVPIGGEMVVHFIDQSFEAAALYHNQKFDIAQLSREFLFARFAWAIIQQAKKLPKQPKRVSLTVAIPDASINKPQVQPQAQGSQKAKKRKITGDRKGKRKAVDDAPSDVNDFQVNEAQELAEDLRLAKSVVPFFFEEPDLRRDRYHSMMWYPGQSIMERRKREYMDAHPNIRARSETCPSLSSDNSDSEEEDY